MMEQLHSFYLNIFLGIDMFDTATRILSLSQRPFTTQFGKGCCVSTSTKTPRKKNQRLKVASVASLGNSSKSCLWYTKSNPSVY